MRLQKPPPRFFQAATTEQRGDRSSRFVDRDDNLQVSRVVDQAFQRLLGALEPDQRLVESLLFVGDPPEFHQSPRIRLVDIRVVGATSSPFQ